MITGFSNCPDEGVFSGIWTNSVRCARENAAEPQEDLDILLHGLDRHILKAPVGVFISCGQVGAGQPSEGQRCAVGPAPEGLADRCQSDVRCQNPE